MALFEKAKSKGLLGKIGTAALGTAGFFAGGPPGAAAGVAAGQGLNAAGKARKDAKGRSVNPVKQSREMLQQDVDTLRDDPMSLGMDEAERQQQIAEATQQAGAMQQAQTAQLARSALAGQGFQQGAFTDAAQQIASGGEQAAATAAANAQALNQQIIASETSRIRAGLEAERQRVKENTRYWTQFGFDTVGSMVGAALGMPGVGEAVGGVMTGAGGAAPSTGGAPPAPATGDIDFSNDTLDLASRIGYQGGY